MDMESALAGMRDAGCSDEEIRKAKQLHETGDTDALIRHFRLCRCSRMEELHKSQRKVDCLDYLIRQAVNSKAARRKRP